ncbi:MAG: hypothetical protein IT245_02690 [Bacteroidia bacterium]|nr:hypothetical protein [Bacteroidia bacterium]
MNKKILFSVIGIFAVNALLASIDSSKSKIIDAYLLGGGYSNNTTSITLQEFQAYNPDSKLLLSNFSNMTSYGISLYNEAAMFNLAVGAKFFGENGPTLRTGICIGSGSYIQGGYYSNEKKHIDTLISPRTGATAYIDSIFVKSYNFNTRSDLMQLDVAFIWRTHNNNKMTVFGGFGGFVGGSFNVFTEISHFERKYLSTESPYINSYSNSKIESFKNKNHLSYGAYIPFGLDYKISKQNEFWSHFHLVFESRIRLQYYKVSGINSNVTLPYNAMFGLRYKFS